MQVLIFLIILVVKATNSYLLEYEVYDPIPMWSNTNIGIRVTFDPSNGQEEDLWEEDEVVALTFNLTNADSWSVGVLNESLIFKRNEIKKGTPKQLTVEGVIVGVNEVQILGEILKGPSNVTIQEKKLLAELEIRVILKDRVLNTIFTGVITLMVLLNTINMGGQLDVEIIKNVFKKPIGPGVGFLSQFLLMPLFSYGVGWLLFDDKLFRLGLFVLGCCPGGTGSNFWCILLNGDINLSITMTFISTIAALGMMPLWLFLLGPYLTEGDLVIPFAQLIFTLIMLVVPVAFGMWIRFRWTKAAEIMAKIIVPVTLLTVIFIFTAGIYLNLFIFLLMTGKMVTAGFLIAGCGYVFGALLAWAFRLGKPQITAVSIETAFQNGSIAFILLRISLPEPYGDLASVAPVAQLIITGSPLWLLYFGLKIYQRFIKKKQPKEDLPTIQEDKTKMPLILPTDSLK